MRTAAGWTMTVTTAVAVALPWVTVTGMVMVPENPGSPSTTTLVPLRVTDWTCRMPVPAVTLAPVGTPVRATVAVWPALTVTVAPAGVNGIRVTVRVEIAVRPRASRTW